VEKAIRNRSNSLGYVGIGVLSPEGIFKPCCSSITSKNSSNSHTASIVYSTILSAMDHSTMDNAAIRAAISERVLDRKLGSKGQPKWSLAFQKPLESPDLTFDYLEAGVNKLVFRVKHQNVPTDWVLCFQSNEREGVGAGKIEFEGEVNTLVRLGEKGVRVPQPFLKGLSLPDYVF